MTLWKNLANRTAINNNEVHILLINIPDNYGKIIEWSNLLSEDEKKKARSLAFEKDKTRYTVSQGFLRFLLGQYLAKEPKSLIFSIKGRGKPILMSTDCRINFNLSHSDNYIIYAISRNIEIGIDIELIKPFFNSDQIVSCFFSQKEINEYNSLSVENKEKAFFSYWTRKEAFIKALGNGLYMPLDRFSISHGASMQLVVETHDESIEKDWYIEDIDIGDQQYKSSVAIKGKNYKLLFWR